MKKVKSSLSLDRISELPDSLIFHIFWFLPIKDVVRTTILSRRWKKLWTTAPCLNLDYSDHFVDPDVIRNSANRALIFWEGGNIEKFKIGIRYNYFNGKVKRMSSIDPCLNYLDCWVHFVLGKKVQELYVHLDWVPHLRSSKHQDIVFNAYTLPQNLYSCSWLKALSIAGCCIEIKGNVRWDKLKSLTIDGDGKYITASAVDQVLCGSPRLEVFILVIENTEENWSIRSSSLKRLLIRNRRTSINSNAWKDFELRIWTPNVESLEISGAPFGEYLLMDVSSVTHATFGFTNNILLGEALRQIFPTIQQVEKLELSDGCIQVLGDMNKEDLISSLSNVKFLKLKNRVAKCNQIVGVLEIFPELKMLTLEGSDISEKLLELDTNFPASFLQHLRTIQITLGYSGYNCVKYPLIKTMLKYASKLEKMVMRCKPPRQCLLVMSQVVLRMPRSSPKAELVFFEGPHQLTLL